MNIDLSNKVNPRWKKSCMDQCLSLRNIFNSGEFLPRQKKKPRTFWTNSPPPWMAKCYESEITACFCFVCIWWIVLSESPKCFELSLPQNDLSLLASLDNCENELWERIMRTNCAINTIKTVMIKMCVCMCTLANPGWRRANFTPTYIFFKFYFTFI